MKAYLQNGSENRQFSKDQPFMSRGLLIFKSAFLAGHVLQTVSMFLQNWLIHWFQPITDAFTVPSKNRVTGASTQWRNWSKIRRRTYKRTHKFKRRPHKSPSGNYLDSDNVLIAVHCERSTKPEFSSLTIFQLDYTRGARVALRSFLWTTLN